MLFPSFRIVPAHCLFPVPIPLRSVILCAGHLKSSLTHSPFSAHTHPPHPQVFLNIWLQYKTGQVSLSRDIFFHRLSPGITSVLFSATALCHDRFHSLCKLVLLSLSFLKIFPESRVVDLDLRLCSGRTNDNCLFVLQLVDQNIC